MVADSCLILISEMSKPSITYAGVKFKPTQEWESGATRCYKITRRAGEKILATGRMEVRTGLRIDDMVPGNGGTAWGEGDVDAVADEIRDIGGYYRLELGTREGDVLVARVHANLVYKLRVRGTGPAPVAPTPAPTPAPEPNGHAQWAADFLGL